MNDEFYGKWQVKKGSNGTLWKHECGKVQETESRNVPPEKCECGFHREIVVRFAPARSTRRWITPR